MTKQRKEKITEIYKTIASQQEFEEGLPTVLGIIEAIDIQGISIYRAKLALSRCSAVLDSITIVGDLEAAMKDLEEAKRVL